jgi:hypothetical protein
VTFTLDEAIALADSAHRGGVDRGRDRGGEHRRALVRLVGAAGYGPAHQIVAALHDDDTTVGPWLCAQARERGAPPEVVTALEALLPAPAAAPPDAGGADPWHDVVARAAADDLARVVLLLDGALRMLPWHATDDDGARHRLETWHRPSQPILLATEAWRRKEGLAGHFPVERGAFVRWAIALDTRVKAQGRLGALSARLHALAEAERAGDGLEEGLAAG